MLRRLLQLHLGVVLIDVAQSIAIEVDRFFRKDQRIACQNVVARSANDADRRGKSADQVARDEVPTRAVGIAIGRVVTDAEAPRSCRRSTCC